MTLPSTGDGGAAVCDAHRTRASDKNRIARSASFGRMELPFRRCVKRTYRETLTKTRREEASPTKTQCCSFGMACTRAVACDSSAGIFAWQRIIRVTFCCSLFNSFFRILTSRDTVLSSNCSSTQAKALPDAGSQAIGRSRPRTTPFRSLCLQAYITN